MGWSWSSTPLAGSDIQHCVASWACSTRGFGTLRTRFGLVRLAPFFLVPASSAVPGYCRASSPSRSQLRLSGFASLLGLLPPLAARSTTCRPSHVSANSQSLYSSSAPLKAVGLFSRATRRLTPERLVLGGWSLDRFAQSSPHRIGGLPANVLASSLLWLFTRLQSTRFHARFQLAAQPQGVLKSTPLPCKVRHKCHTCAAHVVMANDSRPACDVNVLIRTPVQL